ncbi:type I-C CRISPR-associated protein Cas5c [Aquincola tertiaricarbonis]|uniref:pre-crRNA processing endonuclease n=1 Tax=Aquincola tertiaricarbonis TaxID=391953 RepID=A0ABY4S3T5_AQUTE|nr:type I-C CRISPR-associated protein Cas5c [Aquincola tertiaricarbonis]URI06020.1 type I-C CRISPR-associated protein Cas5c [Aquincola tertiaricarbonis]
MRPEFCLDVRGDYACFTRPEMKVERVSYDFITPSAARSVFESILWKPEIRWRMERIEVLSPVRWISVRRNEVGAVVSARNVAGAMQSGKGQLGLYVEKERQQRAGLFLRDVAYRLYARMEPVKGEAMGNLAKYTEMFQRRASKGQCVNQPYLGCREFDARVRLVASPDGEPEPLTSLDGDFGWMLYDMDFTRPADPRPMFFRAQLTRGVLDLTQAEVRS